MNQIERARLEAGVPGVAADDVDVAETSAGDKFRRHRDVDRVGVKADDPSPGRDPLGQEIENPARSAAEIERAVAGPQSNPVKQQTAVER